MNVLADTNVILDVILKREPHFADSYAIFNLAVQDKLHVMVTATSVTDIYYLLRRSGLDDAASRDALLQLFSFIQLVDVRPDDILRALISPVSDFEDGVAVETARRNQCAFIVTRNVNDFLKASIPAVTPQKFIQLHKADHFPKL